MAFYNKEEEKDIIEMIEKTKGGMEDFFKVFFDGNASYFFFEKISLATYELISFLNNMMRLRKNKWGRSNFYKIMKKATNNKKITFETLKEDLNFEGGSFYNSAMSQKAWDNIKDFAYNVEQEFENFMNLYRDFLLKSISILKNNITRALQKSNFKLLRIFKNKIINMREFDSKDFEQLQGTENLETIKSIFNDVSTNFLFTEEFRKNYNKLGFSDLPYEDRSKEMVPIVDKLINKKKLETKE